MWKVQISTRKKLALAGICSLTAVIICISAIRISLGSSGGRLDDATYISLGGVEIAIGNRFLEGEDSPLKLTYFSSLAIVVACLASFRALYTHNARLNRAQFQDRITREPILRRTEWYRVPLGGPEDACAIINAHHEACVVRKGSSRTLSEDIIIPLDSIRGRHDFAVLPKPMDLYRPV